MKPAEYQVIIEKISEQISQCESALLKYNLNLQDINKMTVEDINTTISSCREMQQYMDKFVRDDLYHIIGMANLNAAQTSRIIKLTKELLEYRSDIKYFAGQSKIPVSIRKKESVYKLSSGVKLVNMKGN